MAGRHKSSHLQTIAHGILSKGFTADSGIEWIGRAIRPGRKILDRGFDHVGQRDPERTAGPGIPRVTENARGGASRLAYDRRRNRSCESEDQDLSKEKDNK